MNSKKYTSPFEALLREAVRQNHRRELAAIPAANVLRSIYRQTKRSRQRETISLFGLLKTVLWMTAILAAASVLGLLWKSSTFKRLI